MEFKTAPYAHQQTEFDASADLAVRALLWEMGCVDADTEFLSPRGWRRIADYAGERIAEWNPETGQAKFVEPSAFIVKPCKSMLHISGVRGTDQMVSLDHRMPILTKRGDRHAETITAHELRERLAEGKQLRLPSTFTMDIPASTESLSSDQLRVQVAVMADGSFPSNARGTRRCTMRLKKERKIKRLLKLLRAAGIKPYSRTCRTTGFRIFSFNAPLRMKRWPTDFTAFNDYERGVILDEVFRWDGTAAKGGSGPRYFSKHESDADFIQFLAASEGHVATKKWTKDCWTVSLRGTRTNGYVVTKKNMRMVPTRDGAKYCFKVPSGYWIARRNGKIFPTGNCGKTKPTIDTAAHLALDDKINGLLVVAPNGVHRNWVLDEIPIHLSDDIAGDTRIFDWRTKQANNKSFDRELEAFMAHSRFAIMAVSYDAIMTKKGAHAVKAFLLKFRCMIVLDESQYIKAAGAKRTTRMLNMARYADYRRILSGTPITNNPFDLYPQMKFLDSGVWAPWGIQTHAAYKAFFGVWRKRTIEVKGKKHTFDQLVDFKNQDILKAVVAQFGSRLVKDDVLDLPPKIYQKRYFDMEPAQWRAYRELVDDCRTYFAGGRCTAVLSISKMLRLQQVTSGYLPDDTDEMLHPICDKNPRLAELKDACSEVPDKTIIWAKYQRDIDLIMDMLSIEKKHALQFDGRTDDDARERAKVAFQKGDCQFLVANPAAAGTGLTLHAASTEIFYNTTYKMAERLQAEDRAHRAGMPDRPVTIIDICAQDTIDERIIEALRSKKEIADDLLGDQMKQWI